MMKTRRGGTEDKREQTRESNGTEKSEEEKEERRTEQKEEGKTRRKVENAVEWSRARQMRRGRRKRRKKKKQWRILSFEESKGARMKGEGREERGRNNGGFYFLKKAKERG